MPRLYTAFDVERDYWVPLLELLAHMPDNISKPTTVLTEFERRYGQYLGSKERELVPSGQNLRWRLKTQWSRYHLTLRNLVTTIKGIWTITDEGLTWLKEHPDATHLTDAKRRKTRQTSKLLSQNGTVKPDQSSQHDLVRFIIMGNEVFLGRERVLDVARQALAAGLPIESQRYDSWVVMVDGQSIGLRWLFRRATGLNNITTYRARYVLERIGIKAVQVNNRVRNSKQANAKQPVQTDIMPDYLETVHAEIQNVRDFLQGRLERPSDERLCDQVIFCYTAGLFREVCELFPLIDAHQVNEWYYRKVQKVAGVCEMKVRYA